MDNNAQPHWYAAYVCANHEKRVGEQFVERAIEHFLPVYETLRRWKDRRVRLHRPLFPGYVFVRIPLQDRLRVLQTPRVVRLVGFNGLPSALPDDEMEALRNGIVHAIHAEPHTYLTVGQRVRITGGPLTGLEGILLRKRANLRVVVSLDLIHRSFVVNVDCADVRPIPLLKET